MHIGSFFYVTHIYQDSACSRHYVGTEQMTVLTEHRPDIIVIRIVDLKMGGQSWSPFRKGDIQVAVVDSGR
jgi:hypothetical protein